MKGLLRSGAVISVMTLLSRVMGLTRDIVIARYFPIGGMTDAFFSAFRIPNLLRRLVGEGAFGLAFIPVLTEYKETRSKQSLQALIDHVCGMLGLILLLITLIGVIASPIVMYLFAPGFANKEGAEPLLAEQLLRIVFPYILFISLSGFVSSILNTWRHFAVPAFTPVLLNLFLIIAAIYGSPYFEQPIMALAWGVLAGGIAQLVFQLPSLYRLGLFPRPRLSLAHKGVNKVLKLMLPALFGSSVAQINLLLNTLIASFFAVGSISWLYFSDRFVELPLALFGVAIGIVILPKLSTNFSHKQKKIFTETIDWATRIAILMALPAMVGLVLLAKPILSTVLGGSDTWAWSDVEMASLSLMTYSLGLPAFILVKVLAPAFYSRQDTKTPVTIGIIAVAINILLNLTIVLPWYLLGYPAPHAGLALSTALAGFSNAAMLVIMLYRQHIFSINKQWIIFVIKLSFSALIMGCCLYLMTPVDLWWKEAPTFTAFGVLAGLILSGFIIYGMCLILFRIPVRKMMANR